MSVYFTNNGKHIYTSISCRWRTRVTHCSTANVLQTKVDVQRDKLVTELSRQRLRQSTFSSHSELFVESRQFSLTPSTLGASVVATPFEFSRDLWHQKLWSLGYREALFAWYRFSRLSTTSTVTDDRQTHDYGIYGTSMALCGNKMCTVLMYWYVTRK